MASWAALARQNSKAALLNVRLKSPAAHAALTARPLSGLPKRPRPRAKGSSIRQLRRLRQSLLGRRHDLEGARQALRIDAD